jgi:hypothetical protein
MHSFTFTSFLSHSKASKIVILDYLVLSSPQPCAITCIGVPDQSINPAIFSTLHMGPCPLFIVSRSPLSPSIKHLPANGSGPSASDVSIPTGPFSFLEYLSLLVRQT